MEPEEPFTFREYPSMQICERQAFQNKLRNKTNLCDPGVIWVASQKIHGANFSVYCDGKIVKYGRRNGFLTKQIPIDSKPPFDQYFLQSFYNAKDLVSRFHHNLSALFKRLSARYPKLLAYSAYGEFFGGNWVDNSKVTATAVQKVLTYSPKHEFLVFDVGLKTEEGDKWVKATELGELVGQFIGVVPIFMKGSFDEVIKVDIRMDSMIPELLGYQKVKGNLIQGMVIRPDETHFLGQKRVIIKKKNKDYLQREQPTAQPTPITLPEHLSPIFVTLRSYLNTNRLLSTFSKFPDQKDRGKLCELITKDIFDDAEKDQVPLDKGKQELETELKVKVLKQLEEYFDAEKRRKRYESKRRRKKEKKAKEGGKQGEEEDDNEEDEEDKEEVVGEKKEENTEV